MQLSSNYYVAVVNSDIKVSGDTLHPDGLAWYNTVLEGLNIARGYTVEVRVAALT
jgi:hypothetical protein